jgi:methanogenic corrinoid protein MtbC1
VDGVAVPLLRTIGDEWASGELTPVYEHGVSVALRRVLSWLLEALPAPATAPLVVCGTPPEQRHEFGAMLAGVVAAAAQWRVLYLGPDLPAAEIARAAIAAHADAVAISVLMPLPPRALTDTLHDLRAALPPTTSLVVGGAAATASMRVAHASGATLLRDLDAWDVWLRANGRRQ